VNLPAVGKWIIAVALAEALRVPAPIVGLLLAMTLDFISGLVADLATGKVCGHCNRKVLARLAGTAILLTVAGILDKNLGADLGLVRMLTFGFMVNEAIVVVENCARAGAPIPDALVRVLSTVKQLKAVSPEDLHKLEGAD
jgi:phage-related holin